MEDISMAMLFLLVVPVLAGMTFAQAIALEKLAMHGTFEFQSRICLHTYDCVARSHKRATLVDIPIST
jgi:hypothetical protein